MVASCGITLTPVPPSILPTLKVVRGSRGVGYEASRAIVLPTACTGFSTPKSPQEWPPRPANRTRYRREPSAALVIRSAPGPSRLRKASTRLAHSPALNRCRTPRRFPSPSSPTVPTNSNEPSVSIRVDCRARLSAISAASPHPSSDAPGANSLFSLPLTEKSVPGGRRCRDARQPPALAAANGPDATLHNCLLDQC